MNILSQRDLRWKDIKLGNSDLTIGSYGCTITCIAMLAGLTPIEVNDRMKSVGGFQGALVLWSKINAAIPWLKWTWRGYSYDNDKVSDAINKYGACLVEVDFDGNNNRTDDKHWVLFKGDQKMNDPWTGTEEATNKYDPLTGYAVIEVDESLKPNENDSVTPPQNNDCTDEEKKCIEKINVYYKSNDELKNGNLEGAVDKLIGWANDIPNYKNQLSYLILENKKLTEKLAELQPEGTENEENESSEQSGDETANDLPTDNKNIIMMIINLIKSLLKIK